MSQSDIYKHLLGTEAIETNEYTDIKGVRIDRVDDFIGRGYVVIKKEELSDIVLMGIPKAQEGGASA